MSYSVSVEAFDYYTAEKFAKSNSVKFLSHKELLKMGQDGFDFTPYPIGPFWTSTRISCSTQLVWQRVGPNINIVKYDKTFTAFMFWEG